MFLSNIYVVISNGGKSISIVPSVCQLTNRCFLSFSVKLHCSCNHYDVFHYGDRVSLVLFFACACIIRKHKLMDITTKLGDLITGIANLKPHFRNEVIINGMESYKF